METIINYIDNLFRSYPNTPEVRKAREELFCIMEDKYHELKAEGKSENEAIGIVISEFGSMDEIAFELGLNEKKETSFSSEELSADRKTVTLDDAAGFLKAQELFGMKIAVGIALCILSPTAAVVLDTLAYAGLLPQSIAESFGATLLFFMVAAAVGIFIISGVSNQKYSAYHNGMISLDFNAKRKITEQSDAYNPVFGIVIASGVICCIFSVIPAIFLEAFFGETGAPWVENLSGLCLFVFVAAGVFLFITAGIKKGAYETLLGKSKPHKTSAAQSKRDKIIRIIAGIYWPVVTIIYLLISFLLNRWNISWMIWPVAAILFGGISAVISKSFEE